MHRHTSANVFSVLTSFKSRHVLLSIYLLTSTFISSVAYGQTERSPDELMHLLKQDCGSCHGMRLKGGLGPELSKEKMGQLGVGGIYAVVKYGRPGTAMPSWSAILSDNEIEFLANKLVEGVQ